MPVSQKEISEFFQSVKFTAPANMTSREQLIRYNQLKRQHKADATINPTVKERLSSGTAFNVEQLCKLVQQVHVGEIKNTTVTVKFFLMDYGKTTITRHSSTCFYPVADGRCSRCGVAAGGVEKFAIEMVMTDTENEDFEATFSGWGAAAEALFPNLTASQVKNMSRAETTNVIAEW